MPAQCRRWTDPAELYFYSTTPKVDVYAAANAPPSPNQPLGKTSTATTILNYIRGAPFDPLLPIVAGGFQVG